ncbi:MAG: ribonucleotide-diphosphate reductase subunit beta [Candidatus Thermoplasmatota archaeon]|jgi:ribonucleoside-diphosphate reductase beta chain|nr:ribonucleotide-diphosphate reductase subunit beta [Candidatus Thermoplasmatota archaeon]
MIETKTTGLAFHDRLSKILLFNESGDKWISRRRIVGGSKTNIMELSLIKYQWAADSYRAMFANIFNPMQFNLARENRDYSSLSDIERRSFERLLSSLIFVESVQLSNLQNMTPYFTAPEVVLLLNMIEFQTSIHLDVYGQLVVAAIPENRREQIYDAWRTTDQIKQKNLKLNEKLAVFAREPFADNLLRNIVLTALIANVSVMTEIAPIYALSRHSKMIGTANALKYVQRDVTSHAAALIKLFEAITVENPSLNSEEMKNSVHALIREYVQVETDFIHYSCEGMLVGLTDVAISRFSQALANKTSKGLGYELLFPGITMSPIPWFDSYAEIKR